MPERLPPIVSACASCNPPALSATAPLPSAVRFHFPATEAGVAPPPSQPIKDQRANSAMSIVPALRVLFMGVSLLIPIPTLPDVTSIMIGMVGPRLKKDKRGSDALKGNTNAAASSRRGSQCLAKATSGACSARLVQGPFSKTCRQLHVPRALRLNRVELACLRSFIEPDLGAFSDLILDL